MRATALSLAAISFALAGCTPEPVDIPADLAKAAPVCFVTKALSLRDAGDIEEDKPAPLAAYASIISYLMIASAKSENFNIETGYADLIPNEDSKLLEDLQYQDYEAAVGQCDKKFGISGKDANATLPKNDSDAVLSCYAMVQHVNGIISEDDIDTEGKGEFYAGLTKRFEAKFEDMVDSDPQSYSEFGTKDGVKKAITESLRVAFEQGNPVAFLDACDKRFPAKK